MLIEKKKRRQEDQEEEKENHPKKRVKTDWCREADGSICRVYTAEGRATEEDPINCEQGSPKMGKHCRGQ